MGGQTKLGDRGGGGQGGPPPGNPKKSEKRGGGGRTLVRIKPQTQPPDDMVPCREKMSKKDLVLSRGLRYSLGKDRVLVHG